MSDDSSTLDQFTNQFRQTDDDKTDDQTGTESDVKQGPDVKPKAENEVEVESEGGVVDDLDESGAEDEESDADYEASAPAAGSFTRDELVRLQFRVTESQRDEVKNIAKLWESTNDWCDDVTRPEFQMAAVEVLMNNKGEWLSLVQDKYGNTE